MFQQKRSSLSLVFLLFLMLGCTNVTPVEKGDGVKISGTITYDRVPLKQGNYGLIGLDYNNIRKETGKNLYVKAVDANGGLLYTTTSDNKGEYTVYVPKNTSVKIRVYTRMYRKDFWDVSVVDNTKIDSSNKKATYVMEGSLIDSGTTPSIRNLHASSGWDGQAYSGARNAAPFAILDSINTVMQKVIQAKSDIVFPKLTVNWSTHNVAAGGDRSLGQIVTSNYDGEDNLWILGDANSDTDEYDDHIIIHEWGHFFEDKFSRSDSIGGPHSSGDSLDIRVAFGEGWGNALSAIATDNPLYFDTSGYGQGSGWSMNIESAQHENPGWFSEASVQRILYDLYDDNSDGADNLNLGFKPIFEAMINDERNTPAFTSIFSFIHALKSKNPLKTYQIDEIVRTEEISPISDAYGKYRSNTAMGNYTSPIYRDLEVGKWITQCNQNQYGVYNKLGNRTFIKVKINATGFYTFTAQPYRGGVYGDPDMVIYKAEYPFKSMGMSPLEGTNSDSLSINLAPNNYMLEVYDASFNNSCFTIKLTKETGAYKPVISKGKIERKPLKMPQY